MKKLFYLVFILLIISPSASGSQDYIAIHFSDVLEVGDTFYWKLVSHQFEGEEASGFAYQEGSIIKGVITGNLSEDITNIDIYVDDVLLGNTPGTTDLWPYLSTRVDFIILILYNQLIYANGSTMSYFDFQKIIYDAASQEEELINYQNVTIEGGEYIFQQSVKSNNIDGRTYIQNDRYDYETGVLNYHSHKEVDDDGSVYREALLERLVDGETKGSFINFPFTSILFFTIQIVFILNIYKRRSRK
ncbi:MAG: hypothetical protein GPJ54_10050 [Candidatus Heimdallarchaeota archaeon]|nr:hypothetical protein [Candidatus Heimdallarchaeota archaeon]